MFGLARRHPFVFGVTMACIETAGIDFVVQRYAFRRLLYARYMLYMHPLYIPYTPLHNTVHPSTHHRTHCHSYRPPMPLIPRANRYVEKKETIDS
jgi:23S rRNA C2498 (ribose-2'-O)-methylase RlmM